MSNHTWDPMGTDYLGYGKHVAIFQCRDCWAWLGRDISINENVSRP